MFWRHRKNLQMTSWFYTERPYQDLTLKYAHTILEKPL